MNCPDCAASLEKTVSIAAAPKAEATERRWYCHRCGESKGAVAA